MFTGLVDHCAVVEQAIAQHGSRRLRLSTRFPDLVEGESIAVDGACLTVVKPEGGSFWCDVSSETERLTVAARYTLGTHVNVERAMRLSDRLGGHLVTGHVDQTGVVVERREQGGYLELHIGGVREEYRRYLLKKGSICVQGVSLTVNDCLGDSFRLTLVPHTLERTNLAGLRPGDAVNLEFDWMTKVILNDVESRRRLLDDNRGTHG